MSPMLNLKAGMVGALLTLSSTGTAGAYSLGPKGTSFTLSGNAGIYINGQPKTCAITMTGKIAQHDKTSDIFSFSDNGTCGVVGMNLPWNIRAKSGTIAVIKEFAYAVPNNICPAKNVDVTVSGSGEWSFRSRVEGSTGPCSINTVLQSDPPITIVP